MFRLLHAPSISKKVSPFYCCMETITFCCIIYTAFNYLFTVVCLFYFFSSIGTGFEEAGTLLDFVSIEMKLPTKCCRDTTHPYLFISYGYHYHEMETDWFFFFPRIILKKSIHISHTIGQQSLLFIF